MSSSDDVSGPPDRDNPAQPLAALAASRLTRLLIDVMSRRAAMRNALDVLRQYVQDRFTSADGHDLRALHAVQDALLDALPRDTTTVDLAPLIPFGAHALMGGVAQSRIVSTIRALEVAADPTNGLALEIAHRRKQALRERRLDAAPIRLATLQRVTRAQMPPGKGYRAHFGLFAHVSGGRDPGEWRFHHQELAGHLAVFARFVRSQRLAGASIRLTPLSAAGRALADRVCAAPPPGVRVSIDDAREHGRNYYERLCLKLFVAPESASDATTPPTDADFVEVGDGGFVPWIARLLDDRRERTLISAIAPGRVLDVLEAQAA